MVLSQFELRERGVSPFVAECVSNNIPRRAMRTLDAPCGYGRHSLYLRELGNDVTSVDIDEERVLSFSGVLNIKNNCHGIIHDLNIYCSKWYDKFDLIIIVDFWSKQFAGYANDYIKSGGYLIVETMGNRGGNWIELPKTGETLASLGSSFEIITSKIIPAGPSNEAETAKVLARRL